MFHLRIKLVWLRNRINIFEGLKDTNVRNYTIVNLRFCYKLSNTYRYLLILLYRDIFRSLQIFLNWNIYRVKILSVVLLSLCNPNVICNNLQFMRYIKFTLYVIRCVVRIIHTIEFWKYNSQEILHLIVKLRVCVYNFFSVTIIDCPG